MQGVPVDGRKIFDEGEEAQTLPDAFSPHHRLDIEITSRMDHIEPVESRIGRRGDLVAAPGDEAPVIDPLWSRKHGRPRRDTPLRIVAAKLRSISPTPCAVIRVASGMLADKPDSTRHPILDHGLTFLPQTTEVDLSGHAIEGLK